MNLLILAYAKPLTVPGLADAIGIFTTYIEPVVDKLVRGELAAFQDQKSRPAVRGSGQPGSGDHACDLTAG